MYFSRSIQWYHSPALLARQYLEKRISHATFPIPLIRFRKVYIYKSTVKLTV